MQLPAGTRGTEQQIKGQQAFLRQSTARRAHTWAAPEGLRQRAANNTQGAESINNPKSLAATTTSCEELSIQRGSGHNLIVDLSDRVNKELSGSLAILSRGRQQTFIMVLMQVQPDAARATAHTDVLLARLYEHNFQTPDLTSN